MTHFEVTDYLSDSLSDTQLQGNFIGLNQVYQIILFLLYYSQLFDALSTNYNYTTPQYAEWILNKIAKAINETLAGLKCMLQEFRIYFA